jgi:hypothetical protein
VTHFADHRLPDTRPHPASRRNHRTRALLKRTPWICFDRPLVGLPPTWGLCGPARIKETRCSDRS